ncbi:hypothetical protein [Curtobacterium sp. MCBD17_030]|uniref:hypothetical protein n=1 Tax=Curtobacterium sp. MCBD17_030 TaxID=2175649 RepID=UPI000D9375BC|nr:hypothetical protein [Curtobacterium sp. MCBD17_030]PYY32374.1 hypothetical protein DEI89_13155 [Curtobacterium sp. MCBD17_030]
MPWMKVDDGLHSARKVIRIPRQRRMSAMGLWVMAATWCADNLTDGLIEDHEVDELGGTEEEAAALVACGLWLRTDNGYQFHDWTDYQPTREEILTKREQDRRRKAKWRESHRDSDGTFASVPPDEERSHTTPDPTRPDPTRPSSKEEEGTPRKRGHRIPDDFTVTADMVAWSREKAPAVDGKRATEMFINHWQSASGRTATKTDWSKAWRNWLLSDQQRAEERGWKPNERSERKVFTPHDD